MLDGDSWCLVLGVLSPRSPWDSGSLGAVRTRPEAFFRVVVCFAVVAAGAVVASSGPVSAASAPCWQRVIADWSRHGAIQGSYSASCLRQAMQNEPTDLKIYSSLDEALRRAIARQAESTTGKQRRLAVLPASRGATTDGAGTSRLLLVAVLSGVGGMLLAAFATAQLARRRVVGSIAYVRASRRAQPRPDHSGEYAPTHTSPKASATASSARSSRANRPPEASIGQEEDVGSLDRHCLASLTGFLVTDRNGTTVGRVETVMYGAVPSQTDALAVKAGLFRRSLVPTDAIESVDATTGRINLRLERTSIPTLL